MGSVYMRTGGARASWIVCSKREASFRKERGDAKMLFRRAGLPRFVGPQLKALRQ